MSFSPRSHTRKAADAVMIEALESRRLLTTINGSGTFEYIDTEDKTVRVAYYNVTAELIFATGGASQVGNYADLIAGGAEGADLFKVYVTQSTMDSYISIAEVPAASATGDRPMKPFDGALPKGLGRKGFGGDVIEADSGTGNILLGARTGGKDSKDGERLPVTDKTLVTAIGLQPAGQIRAGLEVVNGQDLGRFLFGGTVLGAVSVSGNMDTFYAGWLVTSGTQVGATEGSGNFVVAGDIRNILSTGSIGTDEIGTLDSGLYSSGFVADIGGYLGQIRSMTHDINGQVHVHHGTTNPSLSTPYLEIESNIDDSGSFTGFQIGQFNDALFRNDDAGSAQFLGSFATPGVPAPVIAVTGSLSEPDGDFQDWYAVSLLGGQSVSAMGVGARVVVYDNDLRPVASNANNTLASFQFTAETPGIYRFQVTDAGAYGLVINAGDVALGGIIAGNSIYNDASDLSFSVDRGDFGAVVAGDWFMGRGMNTVVASNGNIRTIQAGRIGRLTTLSGSAGPSVLTPGSVGLIQSTESLVSMEAYVPVGFDYQVIDSAGDIAGTFIANAAFGTIRGTSAAFGGALRLSANADNQGNDGIIDLIDVTGGIGSALWGGPIITTGAGGNVRYVHAGGAVYGDPFFGGTLQETTYGPGQAVTLTDDSGALITLAPYSQNNPLYDPTDPTSQRTIGGVLTVTTLPIRGSGGVAIVRVAVDGVPVPEVVTVPGRPTRPVPELLTITTTGSGISNTAEIGELVVSGSGQGFMQDTRFPVGLNRPPRYIIDPNGAQVLLTGPGRVDLLDFNGGDGNFSSIVNNSGGEIVTVRAGTVGQLRSATTLGLARQSTSAAIRPGILAEDIYPFSQQRIGVVLTGDLMLAAAGQGVGNFRVSGSIISLAANADGVNVDGVFEGINGAIYSGGEIQSVNIGEGVLGSGTAVGGDLVDGLWSKAGIYAVGRIGSVVGRNADIRGEIISTGQTTVPPGQNPNPNDPNNPNNPAPPAVLPRTVGTGIGSINLAGGSIINTIVGVLSDLSGGKDGSGAGLPSSSPGTVASPTFAIGSINITGGGIIGSRVAGAGISSVNVNGFGILNSSLTVNTNGTIGSIVASGYGVRRVTILAGARLNNLRAVGNGAEIPTYLSPLSVRLSELAPVDPVFGSQYDPYTGVMLADVNDLHGFLGTSASAPVIVGVTDSGVLEDVSAVGSRDLGTVIAHQIRSRMSADSPVNPVLTPGGVPQVYPSQFNFANSIRSIRTTGPIDGLQVVTGKVGQFSPGTDVYRLGMTVAGPIANIVVRGSLAGNSFINSVGPNGRITGLRVFGNMVGNVFASTSVGTINIGGDLTGDVTVMGSGRGLSLGTFRLGGALRQGSLNVHGNVGSIIAASGLGNAGDQLTIAGSVNQVIIGAPRVAGTVLSSDIAIGGNLGVFRINGRVDGSLSVGGTLRNLNVTGDAASGPNILNAPINVGLNLNNARFVGGNVASNVTAGGTVGVFQILNGSLLAGTTLLSQFGNINLVRIANGGLFGSVLAPTGRIGQIIVDSGIGDGTNPLNVTAATMGTLNTRGSILGGATIASAGPLMSLMVSGNVEAGAVVSGAPIVRKVIRGATNGTIIDGTIIG